MRTNGRHHAGVIPPISGRAFAGVILLLGIVAGAILGNVMPARAATAPATVATAHIQGPSCPLAGGGALVAGDAARMDDGSVWACTDDGVLARAATWHHINHACHVRAWFCFQLARAIRSALNLGTSQAVLVAGPDTSYVFERVGPWALLISES